MERLYGFANLSGRLHLHSGNPSRYFSQNVIWMALAFIFLVLWVKTVRQADTPQKKFNVTLTDQHILYTDNVTYSYTVTQEEKDFPLAFSILVYTDAARAIRLLKAIYRPHNQYCIHIDRKSPDNFSQELKDASEKLGDNIIFVSDEKRVDVHWGRFTVLLPELLCAELLFNSYQKWRYLINLTGQEFPLRTNWELVRALKLLNGTNLVEAVYQKRNLDRFPKENHMNFNVTWYKGSVHVVLRREFVNYMLHNPKAIKLLQTLKRVDAESRYGTVPDETFFATLNHNPSVFPIPGAFTGIHEENVTGLIPRFKVWSFWGDPCGSGHWQRAVCMFGLKDLPALISQPHFFANKFIPTVEPTAYDLLEAWIANKVHFEATRGQLHHSFNRTYYAKHVMAREHL